MTPDSTGVQEFQHKPGHSLAVSQLTQLLAAFSECQGQRKQVRRTQTRPEQHTTNLSFTREYYVMCARFPEFIRRSIAYCEKCG